MNLSDDIAEHDRMPEMGKAVEERSDAGADSFSGKDIKEKSNLPEPIQNAWSWLSSAGLKMRKYAITHTPARIVNNSSNVLGASHVATEFVMFKSGMKGNKLIENPQNPVNWVVEPIEKIYNDIATNARSRDFTPKQLFKGDVAANFKKYVVDTKDATLREAERQMASGKTGGKVSLGNPWQTRTTFVGLVVWTLSAMLPERKDSDEEIERMATMRTLHPVQYVGERLRQAVWIPEWTKHKRQMIGLGYVFIGICSMLGSWRQRRDLSHEIKEDAELIAKGLKQTYTFNGAYFGTSILSFLGSLPLLFALDENKGYSAFGTIMMGRIPVMVKSINKKFKDHDPGAVSYTTGMVSFQVENALQALIGGATKTVNPDGSITIADHDALKKEAVAEAKKIKEERKHAHHGSAEHHLELPQGGAPSTVVSDPSNPERAMPERAAEQAAKETEQTALSS